MKCQICGENSGFYPICSYHNKLKEQGLVIKDINGKWILKEKEEVNKKCIICNNEIISGDFFCQNCYNEIKRRKQKINQKEGYHNIYEYYFELNNEIQETTNIEVFNEKIMQMWAISEEAKETHNYNYLHKRVKEDILYALKMLKKDTEIKNEDNNTKKCYVCGNETSSGKQCTKCYNETIDFIKSIDKNRKANELREWYFNLRNSAFRQKYTSTKKSCCNKMIALAIICKNIYKDGSILSHVYDDIKKIMKEENVTRQEEKENPNKKEYDMHKNNTNGGVRCIDGHWVENDVEREIDDMLYQLREPHIYAKKVGKITQRCVKCDWFIPVINDSTGIYIELWGMNTEEYIKNKNEKIALYEEENLPLIQIRREDVLADKTLARDQLESEIEKYKKELKKKR